MIKVVMGRFAAATAAVVLMAAPSLAQNIEYSAYGGHHGAPCNSCGGAPTGCSDCGGCDLGCGGCDAGCNACDGGCDLGVCDACCFNDCHTWGLVAEGELMFFRYHRADGVRVGSTVPGDQAEFDFNASARLSLGLVNQDGFGIRVRWWEYDHTASSFGNDNETIGVDTWTIDLEMIDTVCLDCFWTAEISPGIRVNDFREEMIELGGIDTRFNDFDGFGGLLGIELRRAISCNSTIFARARGAILMDDKRIGNQDAALFDSPNPPVELLDVTVGMTELAIGYEYVWCMDNGAVVYARATAEWQNWFNYSSNFDNVNIENQFVGHSDVGFGGFGFALGIDY